jgi:hypothetical protein
MTEEKGCDHDWDYWVNDGQINCGKCGKLKEGGSEPEWRREWVMFRADVHRQGWKGLWDQIVSMWKGTPRTTVNEGFSFSAYLKPEHADQDYTLNVWGGQIEGRGSDKV